MRAWRRVWNQCYSRLLAELQAKWPEGEGRAVREFVAILLLHRQYPAQLVEAAINQALEYGCTHLDGVKLCLQQLLEPVSKPAQLDLSGYRDLGGLIQQPVDLKMYEQLLLEGFGESNEHGKSYVNGKLPQTTAA